MSALGSKLKKCLTSDKFFTITSCLIVIICLLIGIIMIAEMVYVKVNQDEICKQIVEEKIRLGY